VGVEIPWRSSGGLATGSASWRMATATIGTGDGRCRSWDGQRWSAVSVRAGTSILMAAYVGQQLRPASGVGRRCHGEGGGGYRPVECRGVRRPSAGGGEGVGLRRAARASACERRRERRPASGGVLRLMGRRYLGRRRYLGKIVFFLSEPMFRRCCPSEVF
jgi:hypothetical protein